MNKCSAGESTNEKIGLETCTGCMQIRTPLKDTSLMGNDTMHSPMQLHMYKTISKK